MIFQSQTQKQRRTASGVVIDLNGGCGDAVATLLSLAVVFSGAFAMSTQSAEAKTSPPVARNYFVPPPPPYTPSMVPSALVMTYVQAVTAGADDAVVKMPLNRYSKYILPREQGDTPQFARPDPHVSYYPGGETRILKQIDSFDSEISSKEKEIGELLKL